MPVSQSAVHRLECSEKIVGLLPDDRLVSGQEKQIVQMKSDVSSPLSQCGAARRSTANRKALGKGTPGYFYDPVTTGLSTAAATTASVEAAVSRTVRANPVALP